MAARKLTVYSEARKELAVFEENYNSIVVDCATPKGMKSAKDCRKEIRAARSNLEDLRKETKAPALAKCTQIDTEAKAIKEKLDVLFNKFDGAIKAIENKEAIEAQAALEAAATKSQELDAREQAIFDKEVELGLREAPVEPSSDDESTSADTAADTADEPSSTASADNGDIETICEPHIKVAGERLKVLKAIRGLIEPTDAQPDSGDIDDKIATQHDDVLAQVWELVDVFK